MASRLPAPSLKEPYRQSYLSSWLPPWGLWGLIARSLRRSCGAMQHCASRLDPSHGRLHDWLE